MQTETSFIQSAEAAKSPAAVHAVYDGKAHNAISKLKQINKCHRCKGPHSPRRCCFKMSTCYRCQKQGNITKVCWSKKATSTEASHGSGRGKPTPSSSVAGYAPGQPGSSYHNHQGQHFMSSYLEIMMPHQEEPARDAESEFYQFFLTPTS